MKDLFDDESLWKIGRSIFLVGILILIVQLSGLTVTTKDLMIGPFSTESDFLIGTTAILWCLVFVNFYLVVRFLLGIVPEYRGFDENFAKRLENVGQIISRTEDFQQKLVEYKRESVNLPILREELIKELGPFREYCGRLESAFKETDQFTIKESAIEPYQRALRAIKDAVDRIQGSSKEIRGTHQDAIDQLKELKKEMGAGGLEGSPNPLIAKLDDTISALKASKDETYSFPTEYPDTGLDPNRLGSIKTAESAREFADLRKRISEMWIVLEEKEINQHFKKAERSISSIGGIIYDWDNSDAVNEIKEVLTIARKSHSLSRLTKADLLLRCLPSLIGFAITIVWVLMFLYSTIC